MGRPGTFQPGQSGNPRGRPKKDFELVRACQELAPEAIKRLTAIMRDSTHPQHFAAIRECLDRAYGKAPVVLAGTGGVGPAELTIRWQISTESGG